MALLAIKGHKTRGNEVIALLKMLGGKNAINNCGNNPKVVYYIDPVFHNWIRCDDKNNLVGYTVLTLEEFFEKFPYKVGDKVSSKHLKNHKIDKAEWESYNNRVVYRLHGYGWYDKNELQPYIEEKCNSINFNSHHTFDFADKVELELEDDWEVKNEDGRTFVVRKQQYPKTYEECCKVLFNNSIELGKVLTSGYNCNLLKKLGELLICRDAYWKIAGDWKYDVNKTEDYYYIVNKCGGRIVKEHYMNFNHILAFPTKEMRDSFYENFKDLIEFVKELL